MTKTGDVATRFGLHSDTIRKWVDQFSDFFSPSSQRGTDIQREFIYDDEIVINTICELRKQRVHFEQIRARLAAGERITTLPPTNEPVPQESALAVYAELRELRVQVQERDKEIERLRHELSSERSGSQERIATLREEMAVLRYRLKQLEESHGDV